MIINSIKKHDICNVSFIDGLLSKGIMNNPVFETQEFIIDMTLEVPTYISDEMIGFLYRQLWERCYIKSGCSRIGPYDNRKAYHQINYMITINLSEAISFIHAATPPALRYTIPTVINSISSILDTLRTLLIKSNNNKDSITIYVSKLKEIIHFHVFQTQPTFDIGKARYLHNTVMNHKTSNMAVQILYADNLSFQNLTGYNEDDVQSSVQLLFICKRKDPHALTNMMTTMRDWNMSIDDIYCDDDLIYVSTYNIIFDVNQEARRVFRDSYVSVLYNK